MIRPYILTCILVFAALLGKTQFAPTIQQEFQAQLDTFIANNNIIGLSVAIKDVNNEWTGVSGISTTSDSINENHSFAMGSVSKTITAATILDMYDDGLLDLEDTIGQHLSLTPYLTPSLTIRQLLNHTSGLYNYIQHPSLKTDIIYNSTVMHTPIGLLTNYMSSSSFNPGTNWGYSNTNFLALGMIINSISGQEYYEEARSRFNFDLNYPSLSIAPYESSTDSLAHLWIDTIGDGSYMDFQESTLSTNALFTSAGASGAYVSTPSDLTKWTYDLYSGNILQSGTLIEMIDSTPYSTGYGLGTYLRKSDCGLRSYGHTGGIFYRTASYYCPSIDLAVTVQINDANVSTQLAAFIDEIFCSYTHTVGVKNSTINNSIKLYPNPTTDVVSLSLPTGTDLVVVSIRNSFGQLVFSGTYNNENQISIPLNVKTGLYHVQVRLNDELVTKRLIIN